MKEQNKILTLKSKLLLLLVAGFVALFAFGIRTYAAESYSYYWDYFYDQNDSSFNDISYTANLELDFQIACFINGSMYQFYSLDGSNLRIYDFESNYKYYNPSGDVVSEGIQKTSFSVSSTTATINLNTNIPIFSTSEQVLNYLLYGDDTGQLNKQEPILKENFSLTGFSCDNTITATWTGVSGCPIVDKTNVEVLIVPTYLYVINSGDELQSWDEPDDIVVNYNDMSFYKAYEEFMEGNPYNGSCYLYLSFTPQVMIEGRLYKGSTIRVSYELDGSYSSADIPSAGLPLLYSDFYLKDFSYVEDKNALASVNGNGHNIKFIWNGPSFGDSIDYITSDVKIEIYTMSTGNYESWDWYTYEPSYHVGIGRDYVQFNLSTLDDELRKERRTIFNKDSVSYAGVYFRFTPYYKTSEANYYGRSIYVRLSRNGSVLSCTQSMGDDSSEDNPGYENVVENMEDNSLMGDLLDDIFAPSDDDNFSVDDLTLNFFSLLQGLISSLGQFPSLFSAVFSFLPDYYISMLVVGLSMIILLRILGR